MNKEYPMNNFIETQVEKAIYKYQETFSMGLSKDEAIKKIVKQVTIAVCDEIEKIVFIRSDTTAREVSMKCDDFKKQCGGE